MHGAQEVRGAQAHERTVPRKVMWRLIPLLILIYMMAHLDRVNVSFAALTMNEDLGFSNQVYGLGASLFFLGYFLTGWLFAHHLDSFRNFFLSIKNWIWLPLLAAAAGYVTFNALAMWADSSPGRHFAFYRIGYTLSITGLIVIFTHRLRVPGLVRFLSEASLTIYLYHLLFQSEFLKFTFEWSPIPRVLAMLIVGLVGASLVAGLGRFLLRRHSRLLLGY